MIAFFVPFVVFLFVQIRARSFWDFNNSVRRGISNQETKRNETKRSSKLTTTNAGYWSPLLSYWRCSIPGVY